MTSGDWTRLRLRFHFGRGAAILFRRASLGISHRKQIMRGGTEEGW